MQFLEQYRMDLGDYQLPLSNQETVPTARNL